MYIRTLLYSCLGAAIALSFQPGAAQAGELTPGQRLDPYTTPEQGRAFDTEAAPVSGEVLAEMVVPFDVDDGAPEGTLHFSRGTLTSRVIREPGRPGLTFDYRLVQTEREGVIDKEEIAVTNFTGFSTDVYTGSDLAWVMFAERSADGREVRLGYNLSNLNEYLIVRTDAPAYATGGSFSIDWDFPGSDAVGTDFVATFRPVPEPGSAALLAAAAGLLLRRRRHIR